MWRESHDIIALANFTKMPIEVVVYDQETNTIEEPTQKYNPDPEFPWNANDANAPNDNQYEKMHLLNYKNSHFNLIVKEDHPLANPDSQPEHKGSKPDPPHSPSKEDKSVAFKNTDEFYCKTCTTDFKISTNFINHLKGEHEDKASQNEISMLKKRIANQNQIMYEMDQEKLKHEEETTVIKTEAENYKKKIYELQHHIVKLETELQQIRKSKNNQNFDGISHGVAPTEATPQHPEDQVQPQEEEEEQDEQQGKDISDETWQRRGTRFKCTTCGFTRNTESQIKKHMQTHEEETDDGSFTCEYCPYQNISRNQLNDHMKMAHNPNFNNQMKCNQCEMVLKTKNDLRKHIKENHKSYRPCDFFQEGRCELDDECPYNHVKVQPGQHICFKCGNPSSSKGELRQHIVARHGHIICHNFLQNQCNIRRCFFSHDLNIARNVTRVTGRKEQTAPTSEDFPSLPTARPAVGSQELAPGTQAPTQNIETQIRETLNKMLPKIINQMVATIIAGTTPL